MGVYIKTLFSFIIGMGGIYVGAWGQVGDCNLEVFLRSLSSQHYKTNLAFALIEYLFQYFL